VRRWSASGGMLPSPRVKPNAVSEPLAAGPAVSASGPGAWRVLVFCWFGWVFDFYDLILFSFTKRTIAAELEIAPVAIGWIEGWSLAATAVGGFLFGRLADRFGRRGAMVGSIVVFSAGALLTGVASGFWSLLLARVVTGLGVGGEWGIGHAVVADWFSGRTRDRVHGILQAGSPVAMALAAAVAFFVVPLPGVGWRVVFVGSSALALLAFAGRWAMPGPDRALERAERLPASALWAPAHRRASVVLLAVLTLHMAGFWCVYAELPGALMGRHQVPPRDVGWFQIQVNAVHVVADVAFGCLAAAFGRRPMFVVFCLVFAAGHVVVLTQLDDVAASFGAFTAAVVLMGLGSGTWSCFGALFGAHYPVALRATAAATFYALARFVQLPLKPLLAAPLAAGSFAPALWIGAACALLSAVVVMLLPRVPNETNGAAAS
jgi:MFS family permease